MRSKLLVRAAVGAVVISVGMPTAAAMAALDHTGVVSKNPADYTPRLVPTKTAANGHPHVDDIAQLGATMYAGGLFDTVSNASGTTQYPRNNFLAFDANNGAMSTTITPSFNGQVWAVEADPATGSVYVGGKFTSVAGVARNALVKLNATTGAVDLGFNAGFKGGQISDIELVGSRLIVSGNAGKKLMALNPATGANTGYINFGISGQLLNSRGGTSVFKFDVSPDGKKLVAVGNFTTVAGQARSRGFMADLGTGATLNPWYYPPLAKTDNCNSDKVADGRRIPHLQGVDFSPKGDYFVVVATGRNPSDKPDWEVTGDGKGGMICDAAARFETAVTNPVEPTWINYTGGDSVWAVAATGKAVYVQGHFKYLDNTYGYRGGGLDHPAPTAVVRYGVGAIDPANGKALSWNPAKRAKQGGKEFLATADGLWTVSDSAKFGPEPRYGIAFTPLP